MYVSAQNSKANQKPAGSSAGTITFAEFITDLLRQKPAPQEDNIVAKQTKAKHKRKGNGSPGRASQ